MILQHFIRKENKQNEISKRIYLSIITFINNHYKKNNFHIKKEFNSSFELTTILIFIIFFSYKNSQNFKIKQLILDNFINDLDLSMRNLGIGDMKIGKYVKKYVKKMYYRFDLLDKIYEKRDFENFKKYITNINILNKKSIEPKFSIYLFNYIVDSINSTKYKKFSEFTYD